MCRICTKKKKDWSLVQLNADYRIMNSLNAGIIYMHNITNTLNDLKHDVAQSKNVVH